MTSGRFDQLDGLRALAVSLVFLHHVNQGPFPGGFLGVDLFFVLSGFLITAGLLREHRRHDQIWMFGFYGRRLLRLTPALVVTILISAPIAYALSIGSPTRDTIAAATYTMDIYAPLAHTSGGIFGHTWSLAVEEQFYLVWPALLALLLSRRLSVTAQIVIVMAVTTLGTAALIVAGIEPSDIYRSPLPHIAQLGAGALLATLLASPRADQVRGLLRSPVVPGAVLAVLVLSLPFVVQEWTWLYFGAYTLGGLGIAAMLGHVMTVPDGGISRALKARALVWLGVRSYGFYLWHVPAILTLRHVFDSPWLVGPAALVVTLALTYVSWRFMEKPLLDKHKSRFEPDNRPHKIPPTEPASR